jgi:hypothetical protein
MNCPMCSYSKSSVDNVRESKLGHKYRRRTCKKCSNTYTSYEIELGELMMLFDGKFDTTTFAQIEDILMTEFPTMDVKYTRERKRNEFEMNNVCDIV